MIVRLLKLYGINCIIHIILGIIMICVRNPDHSWAIPILVPYSILGWSPFSTITLYICYKFTKKEKCVESLWFIILSITIFHLLSDVIWILIEHLDKAGFFPQYLYYYTGVHYRLSDSFSSIFNYVLSSIGLFIFLIIANYALNLIHARVINNQ